MTKLTKLTKWSKWTKWSKQIFKTNILINEGQPSMFNKNKKTYEKIFLNSAIGVL